MIPDGRADIGSKSDVDKVGTTSAEALDSFGAFQEYVRTAAAIDGLVPGQQSPFEKLRLQLDANHPEGCRRSTFGPGLPMPLGAYRRMNKSCGLVHADTSTSLSQERAASSHPTLTLPETTSPCPITPHAITPHPTMPHLTLSHHTPHHRAPRHHIALSHPKATVTATYPAHA